MKKKKKLESLRDVQRVVHNIEEERWDDEAAHAMEDRLYEDVFRMIALGVDAPEQYAKAVLKTKKIDFERWCA